jgi:ornithine cyclodeaminase
MPDAESAVRGADLICTTTGAREPVLLGEWISAGAHVNAVGACTRTSRELDTGAVRMARVFTDCRESCESEAGDYLIPCEEGAIAAGHLLGEVGEVLIGRLEGRKSPADVTLFESLGIALEDLAAAQFIHRRAIEDGVGLAVDWGGAAGA